MAIARLRKMLRDGEDGRPPALATVRGEGYRLDP
jgi:DNA-binding winged helix-turn-helix (wHTH) protein